MDQKPKKDSQQRSPLDVLRVEYTQSLAIDAAAGSWSEDLEISVRITSEAITSRWYARLFGKNALDFVVLIAIIMHARPLRNGDLELLKKLRLTTDDDQDRLYARITDSGLADELGINRDTVAAAGLRLEKKNLITILTLPQGYVLRDSRGTYEGTKLYLVSGELQKLLQKDIEDRAEIFRTPPESASDPAEIFRTPPESASDPAEIFRTPPAEKTAPPAEESGTNLEEEDTEKEEVNGGAAADQPLSRIFAYFSERKGDLQYKPTNKDQEALNALLQDGFTVEQIEAAIDSAFERPSKPQYFTLCANIARELRQTEGSSIEPELQPAVDIYCNNDRELTGDVLARLRRMATQCAAPAQADGTTGAEWLVAALGMAQGRAHPDNILNYTDKILRGWQQSGRPKTKKKASSSDADLSPELVIFQAATGRLPLKDQREIVERIIAEHHLTTEDLKPYWEAHIARDKKRTDITWLTDGAAVQGALPGAGYRVTGLDQMANTLRALAQQEETE